MFLTNQNAEIVACILLVIEQFVIGQFVIGQFVIRQFNKPITFKAVV